jgi:hypothetical protein
MARIIGGGSSTPQVSINSTEFIQQAEEAKPSKAIETQSNVQPQNKSAADTRAVTEHKLMGNLQQMRLNSMFDVVPLNGSDEVAWPCKWKGPDFEASNDAVKTESLDIAHQGFLDESKNIW